MHEAALRPVTGPASSDRLAAIGGIDLPGGEAHPNPAFEDQDPAHGGDGPEAAKAPEIIPGERDATTLTHRDPGAVGGQFAGADIPPEAPHNWMDDRTASERKKEGGGV